MLNKLYQNYLDRYAYKNDTTLIDWNNKQPEIILVIPVYHEPDLIKALESIEACLEPNSSVSIITVINASEASSEEIKEYNTTSYNQAIDWAKSSRKYQYHFILDNELPKKHAGVGLARKIGMDEAAKVFISNDRDGVIVCFDADSTCSENLLIEVEKLFRDGNTNGCSIRYAHPTQGDLSTTHYDGIIKYELHLRYYVDALKYANYPYAYQTIGSSMAVRMSAYAKQGGMNRRKAGEDFYFLHKIIPLGHFKNLNAACIFPSARKSDRVPFGTGRAISQWLDDENENWMTYNFRIFEVIKSFLSQIESIYKKDQLGIETAYHNLPLEVKSFIDQSEFVDLFIQINKHTTTPDKFLKRFYQWFEGFKVLKFIHHCRDEFHQNITVEEACTWILGKYGKDASNWTIIQMSEEIRSLNEKEALFVT